MTPAEGDLPQILHLAELLLQLVSQRQFDVLPDLLDAGKAYRGMTKSNLAALVEGLQPQVDQLAEVLTLELAEDRDYVQVLLQAHQKMAILSEQVATQPTADSADDAIHAELLAQTRELCDAMREFLARAKVVCRFAVVSRMERTTRSARASRLVTGFEYDAHGPPDERCGPIA